MLVCVCTCVSVCLCVWYVVNIFENLMSLTGSVFDLHPEKFIHHPLQLILSISWEIVQSCKVLYPTCLKHEMTSLAYM